MDRDSFDGKGSTEQRQGAAGLFMILAWVVAAPVCLVLLILGLWPLALGIGLGLAGVAFWLSGKAAAPKE